MSMLRRRWFEAVVFAALTLPLIGCGPASHPTAAVPQAAAESDEEDVALTEADVKMPANFAAAVERVAACCHAVRAAIDEGHPHKAHRPLDESEIVLNRLPEIARDSGVPKRSWEQVVVAGEAIRDLLGEVHTAIDKDRPANYTAVADRIDVSLASLNDVLEKAHAKGTQKNAE